MNKLIGNKYLIKIIDEYIDYKLEYLAQLKIITRMILRDLNTWRYYFNYCIVYDNNEFCAYPLRYKDETQYRIQQNKYYYNYWEIYT